MKVNPPVVVLWAMLARAVLTRQGPKCTYS
jgi:hypothetical protein